MGLIVMYISSHADISYTYNCNSTHNRVCTCSYGCTLAYAYTCFIGTSHNIIECMCYTSDTHTQADRNMHTYTYMCMSLTCAHTHT